MVILHTFYSLIVVYSIRGNDICTSLFCQVQKQKPYLIFTLMSSLYSLTFTRVNKIVLLFFCVIWNLFLNLFLLKLMVILKKQIFLANIWTCYFFNDINNKNVYIKLLQECGHEYILDKKHWHFHNLVLYLCLENLKGMNWNLLHLIILIQ